jgi:hypothetical protein
MPVLEKDKSKVDGAVVPAAKPDEIERRVLAFEPGEVRVDEGKVPRLAGYAAKYGIVTDIGWFREKIKAGAFDETLKTSDARALKNHDPNLLLGRESSGTLKLESNSVGLKFEITVPDTTTGRDTLEEVRRGDLAGCSFAFTVAEDEWRHEEGKPSERTIVRIGQLFDVGPVTYPAYEDTTVVARSVLNQRPPVERTTSNEQPATNNQQPTTDDVPPAAISAEQQREAERLYRKAGRIINRNRRADA